MGPPIRPPTCKPENNLHNQAMLVAIYLLRVPEFARRLLLKIWVAPPDVYSAFLSNVEAFRKLQSISLVMLNATHKKRLLDTSNVTRYSTTQCFEQCMHVRRNYPQILQETEFLWSENVFNSEVQKSLGTGE